jgi:steroid 5-alpha reductase family enzyme
VSLAQLALLTLCAAAALSAVMTAAWRIQQTSGNSGWIDACWTFGVGGIGILAALAPRDFALWPHWRQIVVAALAGLWSLRLGLHIVKRTRSAGDDPRYRQLIAQWQSEASRRMFWFLQKQAAVGTLLVMSIALAAQNPDPFLRLQDAAGLFILVLAIVGEAIADAQLQHFTSDPANRGAICDVGLWARSRHPNYFFEWLAWLAYPAIAIDFTGANPFGWLALGAPAFMYWALVHISGVKPLEEHMLRTRGESFRAYQKRTPVFFPFRSRGSRAQNRSFGGPD